MKICLLAHSSDLSGANLALLEILETLVINNTLVIIIPSEGPIIKNIKTISEDIDVKIIQYNWWMYRNKKILQFQILRNIFKNFWALLLICKVLKKHNSDYLISNTITISLGFILSIITRKKHILLAHEFGKLDHNLKFLVGQKMARKIIRLSNSKIIVNSNIMKEYYDNWLNGSAQILYYSMTSFSKKIDFDVSFTPQKPRNLLIYGRIEETKGQDIVLKALKMCKERGINYQLTILGAFNDIKFKQYLEQIIVDNCLVENVIILENVDNPLAIIKKHDIVINCSISEAFGRTIVEAMLLKRLVLATENGSGKELIGANERGILFKRDPENLALKLCEIENNGFNISQIISAASKFAHENFNKNNHTSRLAEILST